MTDMLLALDSCAIMHRPAYINIDKYDTMYQYYESTNARFES